MNVYTSGESVCRGLTSFLYMNHTPVINVCPSLERKRERERSSPLRGDLKSCQSLDLRVRRRLIRNIFGHTVCDVCNGRHAARVLGDDGDGLVNLGLPACVCLSVFDRITSVAA